MFEILKENINYKDYDNKYSEENFYKKIKEYIDARIEEKLNSFQVLLRLIGLFVVPLFLIYNQPDLSTSICISIIFNLIHYL